MNQPAVNAKDVERVFELINQCSTQSLKSQIKADDDALTVIDVDPNSDLSYDHWICCIVVAFQEVSITFTTHFTSKAARALASKGTGIEIDKIAPKVSHDFMREYANITAGSIKETLQKCDFQQERPQPVMLPVQEPSFDVVKIQKEEDHWVSHWVLKASEDCQLICSGKVEVSDPGFTSKLDKLDEASMAIDDEGEIDFF